MEHIPHQDSLEELRLELNGSQVPGRADEAAISSALKRMQGGDDMLTLRRPPTDFIQATGSLRDGFALNVYEDANGANLYSTNAALPATMVAAIFARFLRGEGDWQRGVQWQSGAAQQGKLQRRRPGMAGLIALGLFGTAYLAAGVLIALGKLPGAKGSDYAIGWIAIVGLAVYIGWLDVFFSAVRPNLGTWLGKQLGLRVSESFNLLDAGTWTARGGSLARRLIVYVLDLSLLVAATVLPLAIPALLAFLIFGE